MALEIGDVPRKPIGNLMQDSLQQRDPFQPAGLRASPRRVAAEHLVALHEGIAAMWGTVQQREITRLEPTQLSAEVRVAAVLARDALVLPEQFLSMIKESWSALPEVRAGSDPDQSRDQLSGIITLCIREYYRD